MPYLNLNLILAYLAVVLETRLVPHECKCITRAICPPVVRSELGLTIAVRINEKAILKAPVPCNS
jgi:hypothetical protein